MIEINLLPGARKQKRSRTASVDFRAILGDFGSRIRDPWLISAAVGVVLGLGSVGFMYWRTSSKESALTVEEQKAVQDSTRYASVIKDRSVAEAQLLMAESKAPKNITCANSGACFSTRLGRINQGKRQKNYSTLSEYRAEHFAP